MWDTLADTCTLTRRTSTAHAAISASHFEAAAPLDVCTQAPPFAVHRSKGEWLPVQAKPCTARTAAPRPPAHRVSARSPPPLLEGAAHHLSAEGSGGVHASEERHSHCRDLADLARQSGIPFLCCRSKGLPLLKVKRNGSRLYSAPASLGRRQHWHPAAGTKPNCVDRSPEQNMPHLQPFHIPG